MTFPVLPSNIPSGAYQISRSVRLRSSASAYFQRTPAASGNRKTYTWSGWVKRGLVAAGTYYALFTAGQVTGGDDGLFFDTTAGALYFTPDQGATSTLISSSVYRDPSAWYHIVLAVDTTQATSTNRIKMYVNGVQLTSFSTATYPAQNLNSTFMNTANIHRIGAHTNAGYYFDGYLTEINFIDGQALTPSSFGATSTTTGVWGPAKYTGTYGTNGFYLNFSDNSSNTATTIGKDYSGNGNNWTPNNISVTAGVTYDSMVDVPVGYGSDTGVGNEVRGNYCTLNPISNPNITIVTYSNGNLNFSHSSSSGNAPKMTVQSTFAIPSGKWYWEYIVGATVNDQIGIGTMLVSGGAAQGAFYAAYLDAGTFVGSYTNPASGASYTTNDVIGIAYDQPNGTLAFYKQTGGIGSFTLQGTITGISTTQTFYASRFTGSSSTGGAGAFNFGQRAFNNTSAPSGFQALCTQNLSTPTIVNGANYMNATLYGGNSSTQTVNNSAGFYPDFNWIKIRSSTGTHVLVNSVVGGTKQLFSNLTDAEQTNTSITNGISSSGIVLGNNSTGTGNSNISTYTYVLWQWLAGAGSSSSNTDGNRTSTVSVNPTAGFSVVTWTFSTSANNTIGHGLGVAPSFIIVKDRSSAVNWDVYHVSLGYTQRLLLNSTAAAAAGYFAAAPTSTVFSMTTAAYTNNDNIVAYCFAAIAGYSAFGSYTGNGSADGPFVFTGFRPRFIMIKRTDSADDWIMMDSSRSTYNVAILTLYANGNYAEDSNVTNRSEDFLSNGFKVRSSPVYINASGGTYIYAAFAENPFKYALAR